MCYRRSVAIRWQMPDFLSDCYSNVYSISPRLRDITFLQTVTHAHKHIQTHTHGEMGWLLKANQISVRIFASCGLKKHEQLRVKKTSIDAFIKKMRRVPFLDMV